MPTFDAQLNEVSLEHPGFKGIVGTGDGTDIVVLVSEPDAGAPTTAGRSATTAPAALARNLSERLGIQTTQMTFEEPEAVAAKADGLPAAERPDFHVLYDVKTGLRRFMFESDQVTFLDLDEETGRVTVGTESEADAQQVRAAMTPVELANADFIRYTPDVPFVGKMTPSAPADAVSSVMPMRSLRTGRFRPLVGGVRTDYRQPVVGGYACTQGPAVQYGTGTYGFLSNAHCTNYRGRIDGVRFSQPSADIAADFVGIEQAEPAYRSGAFITNGYYSDIAFIRTDAAVQLRGQVANASACSPGVGLPDCVEVGAPIDVIGTASYIPSNSQVIKVGKETGTTMGRLRSTCVDLRESGDKLLCQNQVRWEQYDGGTRDLAYPGDSGSPVFIVAGPPAGFVATVKLVGVLWGGNRDDLSYYNYSPWENIWQQERAGSAYGLPVSVVTSGRGIVSNSVQIPPPPPPGGGTTGGGDPTCPGGIGEEVAYTDQLPCTPPSP